MLHYACTSTASSHDGRYVLSHCYAVVGKIQANGFSKPPTFKETKLYGHQILIGWATTSLRNVDTASKTTSKPQSPGVVGHSGVNEGNS